MLRILLSRQTTSVMLTVVPACCLLERHVSTLATPETRAAMAMMRCAVHSPRRSVNRMPLEWM